MDAGVWECLERGEGGREGWQEGDEMRKERLCGLSCRKDVCEWVRVCVCKSGEIERKKGCDSIDKRKEEE